ncbi:MAG: aminomethyl-transferring glycine dehydrogenase subunit GcvPB [Candidatus Omnitrophica bacterium]|nr:aminomethyl-transferring glycine dehydrogenase subunit GcvPB [Candidatus Omnitrophota bacterium]
MSEPLIFELSREGKRGYTFPECDVPESPLASLIGTRHLRREPAALPELAEIDVIRHFTRISRLNFCVDTHFYPLGSCTMKYNPKVNEKIAALVGFSQLHPLQPPQTVQGMLRLLFELEHLLCEITGMDAFTLQPAAGAHGELVGMMIARAYFARAGEPGRNIVLIPDSGHGTNPSSAALYGFEVQGLASDASGRVDVKQLGAALTPRVAALMLTNPNTLGLFEKDISSIAGLLHDNGSLFYCDGANLNALVGLAKPGDMGIDILHTNMHKTFSTPHGGGGPGAGPVGVKKKLAPFLPVPRVRRDDARGTYFFDGVGAGDSVGRVHAFYGNAGVLLKAYAYIRALGAEGLRQVALDAVLNANYLKELVSACFDIPYNSGPCMHEFVLSAARQKEHGVSALDIAKALIDRGFHPPTVYFPLIVKEALMIEPTETETKETLDTFARVLCEIAQAAEHSPGTLTNVTPHTTPVSRLDEVSAARKPVLTWCAESGREEKDSASGRQRR